MKLSPVIYLNCHDAGRLIRPYGHPVETPCLQHFAEDAILFRNAHSVAPTCSPSRAGLVTGRYPHQVSMLGLAHRGFALDDYSQHLASRLSRAGYLTALSGIEHVGAMSERLARPVYDVHLSPDCRVPNGDFAGLDLCRAEAAARFIEEQADADRPFYLECGFFFPHRPYPAVPPQAAPGAPAVPFYLPDTPRTREDMRAYAAALLAADTSFGVVLDAIRRTGLDRRAIIIITTDHGPAFPWAKCNLNDQGTGVMLMMRLPGVEVPLQSDALVSHLDLLPTILETLGLPKDDRLEGVSLLPLISGARQQVREEVFTEVSYHASYEPMRSVRTERYRYSRRFEGSWVHPVMPNIDDGLSRQELLSAGVRDMHLPSEELYDVIFDPAERRNLVNDPVHTTVLADLRQRMHRWMERTGDPLLLGAVTLPEGATVTPHTALHLT